MITLCCIYWTTCYLAHFEWSEDSVQYGARHAVKKYMKTVPRMENHEATYFTDCPPVFFDKTLACLCLFVYMNLTVNGVGH